MANNELISGVDDFLTFGTESTFGTAVAGDTQLGLVQNFNTTLSRDAKEHYGFVGANGGGQLPEKTTSGMNVTGFTTTVKPLEWTWLEKVMGSVNAADGTAGTPFIYSFSTNPVGITFVHDLDNVTTDREEKFAGCRFATTTIRAALGEIVTVDFDVQSLNFSKDSTLQSNVNLPSGIEFNFAGATLELPDSSAVSHLIDSIEIVITREVKKRGGLGFYDPKASRYGLTTIRVNVTLAYLDDEFLDDLMGSSTTMENAMTQNATLTAKFSSTDANKFVEFKFVNVPIPDLTGTSDLGEFITEGINFWPRGLTVEETQAA